MLYDSYDVEVLADRLEEEMEVINEKIFGGLTNISYIYYVIKIKHKT